LRVQITEPIANEFGADSPTLMARPHREKAEIPVRCVAWVVGGHDRIELPESRCVRTTPLGNQVGGVVRSVVVGLHPAPDRNTRCVGCHVYLVIGEGLLNEYRHVRRVQTFPVAVIRTQPPVDGIVEERQVKRRRDRRCIGWARSHDHHCLRSAPLREGTPHPPAAHRSMTRSRQRR
jgi:hypothetical protein